MRRKVTFDPVLRSCAVILTGLTVLGALMIAEDVAAPLLLAIVMGIVFAPTADRVDRLGLPRWISVFALMLVFFALLGTLAYLLENFRARGPSNTAICTLLDKPSGRLPGGNIEVDYIGFTIPNHFVVGYGLDLAGYFRNLPYVGIYSPPKD